MNTNETSMRPKKSRIDCCSLRKADEMDEFKMEKSSNISKNGSHSTTPCARSRYITCVF